ncbi:MAG: hypothetical protein AUI14_17550 [Actinobacteria bacterium 13_2_20CM_2_71_6]|nr:MAG: hypothetical protein AUI14_17550 [Actinobacteria bacterium 13_2_20CM_2_71_6]
MAGPMIRAVLNVAALSDSALGNSELPTSSEANGCRNGVSTAATVPHRAAKTYTCQSCTAPLTTSTPISAASTSQTALAIISSTRLSNRSASLPA